MSTYKITASANTWGSVLVATSPRSGVLLAAIERGGMGQVCPSPARPMSMTTTDEAPFGVLCDHRARFTSGTATAAISGLKNRTETFHGTAKHDPGSTVWRPPV
jgi:hypothetical protein